MGVERIFNGNVVKKKSVCAVVVTYNRMKYLINTLSALHTQTYSLSAILIVDNNSSDGTRELLWNKGFINYVAEDTVSEKTVNGVNYIYYRSSENSGGAGGFNKGIEVASKMNFDYLWCMDDDVLPDNDCLEELMKYISEDARICLPSRTDKNFKDHAITKVNMSNPFKYLIGARKTYVYNDEIQSDTIQVVDMPFEGPLIALTLVKEIGLPKKELFILFDDSEYAMRASKVTKILYCKSAIMHRQVLPQKDIGSLMNWKNYYDYRNQIWYDRTYGENIFVKRVRPVLLFVDVLARSVVKRRWLNIKVINKAYRDGISGNLGKTVEPGTNATDF